MSKTLSYLADELIPTPVRQWARANRPLLPLNVASFLAAVLIQLAR